MHTIAANAYIAYRSVRDRIRDTTWPFEVDPLCALVLRSVWLNGGSCVSEGIRTELGLPRSTMSSALGRLEKGGHIRRHQNIVDRRYVDLTLTPDLIRAAGTKLVILGLVGNHCVKGEVLEAVWTETGTVGTATRSQINILGVVFEADRNLDPTL